ncbi:hypothetical protein QFZ79_003727 [Arthrobacter sp. V4I6]|uniref:hypothetical protein n=1 Tax=unclassified Arthrobacter TaxID=235627 RepID=UPI0027893CA3|nr:MULTISPECIES: hypothetical protein [unclassified Arthrobacter]MDQ0821352.1 hypothetical protein [Arthrobacter sp. V1I7]MDQ0855616.1 hypothetical protein [Arthrobacter sp. V4I6]
MSTTATTSLRAVPTRWHRPLLWLSLAMAASTLATMAGLIFDPRLLDGAPLWAKPFKFSVSILIYALTLSWLLGQLPRWRRLAWWAGTAAAVFLAAEMIIIGGAAAAGTTSHFNVSTPLAAGLWSVMGASIVLVWLAALLVALLLFGAPLGDPARSFAIRAGFVIALIGMALAFLMTSPTADQLNNFRGIAGAHTVGLPDGGPGLPLLGWSTVAGDLRVPHFVGMHALQLIPLAALLLELCARRIKLLQAAATRLGLLWILVASYLGALTLLTVQALAGQSIVRPDAVLTAWGVALLAGAGLAVVLVLRRGKRAVVAQRPPHRDSRVPGE